MHRGRWTTALVAAALTALLAACGANDAPPPAAAPTDSPTPTVTPTAQPTQSVPSTPALQTLARVRVPRGSSPATPADLIGHWSVTADRTPVGTVATFDRNELLVWDPCGGPAVAAWKGDAEGNLVVDVVGADGCAELETPPWLAATVTTVRDGRERLLVDRSGHVVARLTRTSVPTPGPDAADDYESPRSGKQIRTWSTAAAPLPAEVRPATEAELRGRWLEIGRARDADGHLAELRFRTEDRFRATDDCLPTTGAWRAGLDGALIAVVTGGTSSLAILCDPGPEPTMSDGMRDVARAGFIGSTLYLYDHAGSRLTALRRAA